MDYTTVEKQIANCLGDNYNAYYSEIKRFLPNPTKTTILYCCIVIERDYPNISTFIEEFIKTISSDEINDNMDSKIVSSNYYDVDKYGTTFLAVFVELCEEIESEFCVGCDDYEPIKEFNFFQEYYTKNITLLVNAGANVNAVNPNEQTLLLAIISKCLDYENGYMNGCLSKNMYKIVKILVNNGANMHINVPSENITLFTKFVNYHVENNALQFGKYDGKLYKLFKKCGAQYECDEIHMKNLLECLERTNNFIDLIKPQYTKPA